ncbi:MAG TPA: hypothetical protein VGI55_07515 [Solirubrobacteraceae bacterium]|jgi:hypothetical protein
MLGTDLGSIGVAVRSALTTRRSGLLGALAMAVLLTACGGAGVPTADRSHTTPLGRSRAQQAPKVGTTQRVSVSGAHLSVTVVKVVNLPSDDDAPVLPGFRGVGVKVEISNTGPADYDSLATSDFSIVATDPNVHLLYVPAGLCRTPTRDFDNHITVGETRIGCLAFRIHQQARVIEVTFSPDGKPVGQVSWGR